MTATPSADEIRSQVFDIVAKQAKIDVATIRDDSTLTDLGLASLDAIEVIFDIEERFDISFPEQAACAGLSTRRRRSGPGKPHRAIASR